MILLQDPVKKRLVFSEKKKTVSDGKVRKRKKKMRTLPAPMKLDLETWLTGCGCHCVAFCGRLSAETEEALWNLSWSSHEVTLHWCQHEATFHIWILLTLFNWKRCGLVFFRRFVFVLTLQSETQSRFPWVWWNECSRCFHSSLF